MLLALDSASYPKIRDLMAVSWFHTYEPITERWRLEEMFEDNYSISALEEFFRRPNMHSYGLLENDRLLGFIAFQPLPHPKDLIDADDPWKIHRIYFLPEQQGKGFGKTLLIKAEEVSRIHGADFLYLNVNDSNPAIGFYEKMGYLNLFSEQVFFGKHEFTDCVMGKKIEKSW
jgi:diamine N-acetyltransferase